MSFWKKLVNQFTPADDEPVDWEALLLQADLGLPLTRKLVDKLEAAKLTHLSAKAQDFLRAELRELFKVPPPFPVKEKPEVIMLVGVNGSGKTTSAAKLAHLFQQRGKKVFFGAADTFRAAAVDQLQVWGERVGVPVVTGPPNSDPASVAFRAHEAAADAEADLLIVDTAGRQANKNNLMLELGKIKRVLQKRSAAAPHHVWLVMDATTGANILPQARLFHEAVNLTGLIMTKLDGSARGGMIAAVREELGLRTHYLGRGEQPADLEPFAADAYVREFFSE